MVFLKLGFSFFSHHFIFQLNLLQSVCMSPSARQSHLSSQALPLLKAEIACDMVFEVIAPKGRVLTLK